MHVVLSPHLLPPHHDSCPSGNCAEDVLLGPGMGGLLFLFVLCLQPRHQQAWPVCQRWGCRRAHHAPVPPVCAGAVLQAVQRSCACCADHNTCCSCLPGPLACARLVEQAMATVITPHRIAPQATI